MSSWLDLLKASVLGLIEGLTQFLPVSASGHALLLQRFLGLEAQSRGFALAVKLAALLALLWVYRTRLQQLAAGGGRFALGLAAALMPAAVIAVLARMVIENARLNVWLVCLALILGGALLRFVDRPDRKPRLHDATALPLRVYAIIGIGLCAALIPGVSAAAATIIAAMLLGVDRRAAADLSLWLAIPSLIGILAYELAQDGAHMGGESAFVLCFGFAFSFLAAFFAASSFVAHVESRGLDLFAWWRVLLGTLGLIALAVIG
jgi:undecaprenyl-diphosphatase